MVTFPGGRNRARRAATVARFYRRLAQTFEVADVSERPGVAAALGGRVILPVMDCHSLEIHTVILLSLLPYSATVTVSALG